MLLRSETLLALHAQAQAALERAYAPYSGFRVGAALLLDDASVVTGVNVENASYGLSICAERSALVRAVSERGPQFRVAAIAVANGSAQPSPPCGACRQLLSEFVTPDAMVVFPGEGGNPSAPVSFRELFPHTFHLRQR